MKNQQINEELKNSDLYEFFVDELKDIYWAENHLVKALPKMSESAYSDELVDAFDQHLSQTKNHVERLEQIFNMLEEPAEAKVCEAMKGIVKEAEEINKDTQEFNDGVHDAALIMAGQKVEHYEIATYGALASLAKQMGLTEAADLLAETLNEEKKADSLLQELAENGINEKAAHAEE